jgi:hypothetical protein
MSYLCDALHLQTPTHSIPYKGLWQLTQPLIFSDPNLDVVPIELKIDQHDATKTGSELRCTGAINSSCSLRGTHQLLLSLPGAVVIMIVWELDLQLSVKSVSITTIVVG